jgi:hypothetical protein
MSLNTVTRAANDVELQARITGAIHAEAHNNPALSETQFADQVRRGFAPQFTPFFWSVAGAVQAEYEAGVLAGRGSPGYDADVVTDGQITSAVVAAWPPDPEPPTP